MPSSGTPGPQGGPGSTGPQGPQGAQGAPFGSVYWGDIVGKPATFDLRSFDNSGWLRYNFGLQLMWFTGPSQTSENIVFTAYPVTVGTSLSAHASTHMPVADNRDDWVIQLVNFDNSGVYWASQRINTTDNPVSPIFLVVSQNSGLTP